MLILENIDEFQLYYVSMLITTRTVQSIEKELLERLKRGVYGDIYNYPVKEYNKVLDMEGLQAASEDEDEEVRF